MMSQEMSQEAPLSDEQAGALIDKAEGMQNYAAMLVGMRNKLIEGGFEDHEAFEVVLEVVKSTVREV